MDDGDSVENPLNIDVVNFKGSPDPLLESEKLCQLPRVAQLVSLQVPSSVTFCSLNPSNSLYEQIDSYLTTRGGRDGLTHKVMDHHVYRDLGKNTVNYDRDPLLFFPYVSLPKDLCPPGQTPFQAINEIFEKVMKTGLYDRKLSKWAISENAPVEKVVPEFFNKVSIQTCLPSYQR